MLTQSTRSLKKERTELDLYVYSEKNLTKINSKWIIDQSKRIEILCRRNPCDIEFDKIFLNCTKKALSMIYQYTDLNVTKI